MFIRRTTTRRSANGENYYSYRLVESRREGSRVRQITLLNLGRHFNVTSSRPETGILPVLDTSKRKA